METPPFGKPFGEIVSLMRQRRSQDALLLRQMISVRDRVNGDVVVPLLDTKGEPTLPPPSPRLIADAIDHTAMRSAASRPTIMVPTLDMALTRAVKRAETRRRALYARWHSSQLWDVKLYRSYRHLVGYGTCAFVVTPDEEAGHAAVEIRDPLTTYPELRAPDDIREPRNVGFVFGRSVEWIKAHFPEATGFFDNAAGRNWDTLWDVVEWIDEDAIVMGILGPRMPAYGPQDSRPYGYSGYELRRWRNKAGMVPAVVPRRVTLDRIMGQIGALVGLVDLYDRMTTLMVVAAEKGIFPDLVALGKDGRPAQIVNGDWKDGRTGLVNSVVDGEVAYLTNSPGPQTGMLLDRLESAIRESGNVSDMYGGSNPGGLRTGRALDVMGSFSVDPRMEEAQKIMGRALTAVNVGIVEVEKGYFPDKKMVAFTGWPGDESVVEYTPSVDFDSTLNVVAYPFPGVGVSEVSVALMQMAGGDVMSKRTVRIKHPFIDDADQEEALVDIEATKSAVQQGFEQLLMTDPTRLPLAVKVLDQLKKGSDYTTAIVSAHQEAQAEQAKAAQAQAAQGQPGQPAPGPEAQPGLAGGPPAPIAGPSGGLANLQKLVGALNARTNPQAV
jgi:hypothetical protein